MRTGATLMTQETPMTDSSGAAHQICGCFQQFMSRKPALPRPRQDLRLNLEIWIKKTMFLAFSPQKTLINPFRNGNTTQPEWRYNQQKCHVYRMANGFYQHKLTLTETSNEDMCRLCMLEKYWGSILLDAKHIPVHNPFSFDFMCQHVSIPIQWLSPAATF